MSKYKKNTKEETKKWLKTSEGKRWLSDVIDRKHKDNEFKNMVKCVETMDRLGISVDCKKCLHGIGHHCDLDLKNGCPDYLEVHTLKTIKEMIK